MAGNVAGSVGGRRATVRIGATLETRTLDLLPAVKLEGYGGGRLLDERMGRSAVGGFSLKPVLTGRPVDPRPGLRESRRNTAVGLALAAHHNEPFTGPVELGHEGFGSHKGAPTLSGGLELNIDG